MTTKAFNLFSTYVGPFPKDRRGSGDKLYFFNNGDVSRYHFPLPKVLDDAVQSRIFSRKYGYEAPRGNSGNRKKIAQYEKARTGNETVTRTNIAITAGVAHAINTAFSYLSQGEVIIPTPSYPLAEASAEANGLQAKIVKTFRENEFLLTPDELENVIDANTKAVFITSPNNPTGSEYTTNSLRKINQICEKYGSWLIIDEIFSGLMLHGNTHPSLEYEVNNSNVMRLNGWSKDRGTAGFRIGYIVAPEKAIKAIANIISLSIGNAPTLYNNFIGSDMRFRRTMITGGEIREKNVGDFEDYKRQIDANRRQYEENDGIVDQILGEIDRVSAIVPNKGGFTRFFKVDGVSNGHEFVMDLFNKTGIMLVPGTAFGIDDPGWLRLAFSLHPKKLEEGLMLFSDYIQS